MPYDERDNRELGFDERSDLYEQDPAYTTDTYFGERLDNSPEEEMQEVDVADPEMADEFGETMDDETVDETTDASDAADFTDDPDEQDEVRDKTE